MKDSLLRRVLSQLESQMLDKALEYKKWGMGVESFVTSNVACVVLYNRQPEIKLQIEVLVENNSVRIFMVRGIGVIKRTATALADPDLFAKVMYMIEDAANYIKHFREDKLRKVHE